MLNTYLQTTQLLLNDAVEAKYNLFDLASYVNTARGQVAGEGECIRVYGTLTLVVGQRQYPFSSVVVSSVSGVSGVNNVRMIWFQIPGTTGQVAFRSRSFPWFGQYKLNNPVPRSGQPETWAQFGQGQNGSIFIDPLPDLAYGCFLDLVGVPTPLLTDATAEAIPPLWQDAVPYYAAYMAYLTAGNGDGAKTMMEMYSEFVARARKAGTPSLLPGQSAQPLDPFLANRLGVTAGRPA